MKDKTAEVRKLMNIVNEGVVNLHEGSTSYSVDEYVHDLTDKVERLQYAINRNDFVDDGDTFTDKGGLWASSRAVLEACKVLEKKAMKEKRPALDIIRI